MQVQIVSLNILLLSKVIISIIISVSSDQNDAVFVWKHSCMDR